MARILIIDDDSEFLEMLSLLLGERGGHQIVLSADGTDGLAKAMADPPDMVLLDVMMPGITGYEICRQLRANPPTANIPIIVLTARGQPVDKDAALSAGADEYMSKPVTMATLSERVGTLLEEYDTAKLSSFTGTIALLSLRGGVGVTTLAVNLASTMARPGGRAACLVDLCPSSGHAALQLGLRPAPNWSDLVQAGDQGLDNIEAHLLQHESGLRVLASPIFPAVRQGVPQGVVQRTLDTLQQRFAATVVDTPSVLDEATMATLEAAAVVVLVVTAESPSIQATIGTLGALKQRSAKFRVVLNQVAPGPQTPTDTIERALKRPLLATIPFDPTQAQALAQGAPLVLHNPTSSLAQAVHGLAQALSH